jgi:hypothetical protein
MVLKKRMEIGEWALGGIVDIEMDSNARIKIKARDWDTKEVLISEVFNFVDKFKLQMWLEMEITSAYYADKIINEIYA